MPSSSLSAPMRWGDSDSSDDEEQAQNTLPPVSILAQSHPNFHHPHGVEIDTDGCEAGIEAILPPTPDYSRDGNDGSFGDGGGGNTDRRRGGHGAPPQESQPKHYHHQQQQQQQQRHSNSRQRGGVNGGGNERGGRGGRGSGRGGRSVGGGRGTGRGLSPFNWKQMAKSASKFSSDAVASSDGQHQQKSASSSSLLDGSGWMANRRAKSQQQQNEQRRQQEERQQREEEERRVRRKNQLEALKGAVVQLEATHVSSLQAAAAAGAAARNRAQPPPDDDMDRSIKSTMSTRSNRSTGSHRSRNSRSKNKKNKNTRRNQGGNGGEGGGGNPSDEQQPNNSSSTKRLPRQRSTPSGQAMKIGRPQVVRTTSGDLQYHIPLGSITTSTDASNVAATAPTGSPRKRNNGNQRQNTAGGDADPSFAYKATRELDRTTSGELLPNGTVKLTRSRSNRSNQSRSGRNHPHRRNPQVQTHAP